MNHAAYLVSFYDSGHVGVHMYKDPISFSDAAPCPGVLPIGRAYPWLAPLAGFSDLPFRLLCRELGASVACTEMVSAKGLVLGQGRRTGATDVLLQTVPEDSPLVVQLFGAEADCLETAVSMLKDRGYRWFDLNMGCSVPKVGKSGAGSAMLNDPDNALAVAKAMLRAAGPGRVGFKLRLGRCAGEEVYIPLARRLEDAGAAWLTLHPRYARQRFSGRADRAALAALVREVSLPVLVSGDLFTAADGVAALEETGAAGVMFARGAMQNPSIFQEFIALGEGKAPAPQTPQELEWIIRRHVELVRRHYPLRLNRQGVEAGLLKMRTFVPRYVKRCAGARLLRRELVGCETWAALDVLLTAFFAERSLVEPLDLPEDADMDNDWEA